MPQVRDEASWRKGPGSDALESQDRGGTYRARPRDGALFHRARACAPIPPSIRFVVINDFRQIKPLWRRSGAGLTAVAGGEDAAYLLWLPLAAANELQGADEVAYLMVEEGAGRGLNPDLTTHPAHIQPVEGLDRRDRLTSHGAEGGKVVAAEQPLRRRLHRRHIQASRHPPHPAALQHRRRPSIKDAIEVASPTRGKAGVEVGSSRNGRENRHR